MPIYEFACKTCDTEFEARVARVGERPDACPQCGSREIEKRLSAFAAHTGNTATEPQPCGMGAACGRLTGRCGVEN